LEPGFATMPKRPSAGVAPSMTVVALTGTPPARRLATAIRSPMRPSTAPAVNAASRSCADWKIVMVTSMPAFLNRPSRSATHSGRLSSVGRVPIRIADDAGVDGVVPGVCAAGAHATSPKASVRHMAAVMTVRTVRLTAWSPLFGVTDRSADAV